MNQLLSRNGTLVIFVTQPISITYVQVNGHTANVRSPWDACPSKIGPIQGGTGTAYTVVNGRSRIGKFLSLWSSAASYAASFTLDQWEEGWSPLAVTKTPGVLVAAERAGASGGRIILLPRLNTTPTRTPEGVSAPIPQIAPRFWQELVEAVSPPSAVEAQAQPSWVERYGSEREFALREEARQKADLIDETQLELEKTRSLLREFDDLKPLLYASGDELELAVREAFKRLGVTALPTREGYEDLRLDFGAFVGVCEVKGVKGGATLQYARQLENWASDPDVPEGSKAILIVNGFRELPLNERSEEVFSPRVREYSEARDHLLMTGSQLFSIVAEVEANPELKAGVLDMLRTATGVLPGYDVAAHQR